MFNTILVPTDGSLLSEKAIQGAVDFAKLTGARIVAISVAEPYPYNAAAEAAIAIDMSLYEEEARRNAELHVQKAAQLAAEKKVICETHVVSSFNPYEEIISAAEKYHCETIFMASHGRKGLSRLFIGSETQKVLAHSTVPVMVFR